MTRFAFAVKEEERGGGRRKKIIKKKKERKERKEKENKKKRKQIYIYIWYMQGENLKRSNQLIARELDELLGSLLPPFGVYPH